MRKVFLTGGVQFPSKLEKQMKKLESRTSISLTKERRIPGEASWDPEKGTFPKKPQGKNPSLFKGPGTINREEKIRKKQKQKED